MSVICCSLMVDPDRSASKTGYKYTIRYQGKNAEVTVNGNAIDETIADYITVMTKLKNETDDI